MIQHSTSGYLAKKTKQHTKSGRYLHSHIHSSFNDNTQHMEAT